MFNKINLAEKWLFFKLWWVDFVFSIKIGQNPFKKYGYVTNEDIERFVNEDKSNYIEGVRVELLVDSCYGNLRKGTQGFIIRVIEVDLFEINFEVEGNQIVNIINVHVKDIIVLAY